MKRLSLDARCGPLRQRERQHLKKHTSATGDTEYLATPQK